MLKQFARYTLFASAGFLTVWDNLVYFSRVDGSSMQPVINATKSKTERDYVLVTRVNSPLINLFRSFDLKRKKRGQPLLENLVQRGEIVSIISPKNPKECFIKRIIGMPGDLVKTISYKHSYVVVPQGHCWIEGDNTDSSYDSNSFGCVPLNLIVGKARLILYPLDRLSPLNDSLPAHRKLQAIFDDKDDNNNENNKECNFVQTIDNFDDKDNIDYDDEDGVKPIFLVDFTRYQGDDEEHDDPTHDDSQYLDDNSFDDDDFEDHEDNDKDE